MINYVRDNSLTNTPNHTGYHITMKPHIDVTDSNDYRQKYQVRRHDYDFHSQTEACIQYQVIVVRYWETRCQLVYSCDQDRHSVGVAFLICSIPYCWRLFIPCLLFFLLLSWLLGRIDYWKYKSVE